MVLLNPISIRVDKRQDLWLLRRAKQQGINVSKGLIIRMLIDEAMRNHTLDKAVSQSTKGGH